MYPTSNKIPCYIRKTTYKVHELFLHIDNNNPPHKTVIGNPVQLTVTTGPEDIGRTKRQMNKRTSTSGYCLD